jgi:HSP20 family protein
MTHVIVPRKSVALSRCARPLGLFHELDPIFDALWGRFSLPASGVCAPNAIAPRVDFSETEDEIRVAAELPGLDEKDIEVTLDDGVLTIRGERKDEREEEDADKGYRRHLETFRGHFHRIIRLATEVDEEAVKATYKAGVLTVTLPKQPPVEPPVRSIPITSG